MWTLTARWLIPVEGPPLERGTVTIDGERIVAIEPHRERAVDLDLGNVAILPGLVNAHTHLDLTGMHGLAPPSPDFVGWLKQVIAFRRARPSEQVLADIGEGLAESVTRGTTLLGDISGDGGSWGVLAEAPVRSVVFRELIGLTEERAKLAEAAAGEWLRTHLNAAHCRAGLSPHAPYSARSTLMARAALLARPGKHPIAVHLAESLAELELLHHHRGPFVAFLKELGVWDPDGLAESPARVMKLCDQAIPKLFIHCNHLAPSARFPRRCTVVYCPRTHAAFGHPPHPFRDFLRRGVRVAVGTDSLASNPDLDVLAEIRFLHRLYPDFPGAALLRMATLSGAEALGWDDETGSITPGKSADLVAVPLPNEDSADPYHLLLGSSAPVSAVMCRGRWVHAPSADPPCPP